jgi:ABC-type antimicrobial peptide transport system permease subunit
VTFVGTVFASAALVVCLAGLGAMVAFTVARRTREIAIRMTLGATPALARRMVIQEALLSPIPGKELRDEGTASS